MAIILPYISSAGVEAKEGYHRIDHIRYNYENHSSMAEVKVYLDKIQALRASDPIDVYQVTFTMNTGINKNISEQAYDALKTKSVVTDSKGRQKPIDFSKGKDD
tara:strand:- start:3850 stop:4161 length:312 start_codon:yes stop_codon:yes gene_type:complete